MKNKFTLKVLTFFLVFICSLSVFSIDTKANSLKFNTSLINSFEKSKENKNKEDLKEKQSIKYKDKKILNNNVNKANAFISQEKEIKKESLSSNNIESEKREDNVNIVESNNNIEQHEKITIETKEENKINIDSIKKEKEIIEDDFKVEKESLFVEVKLEEDVEEDCEIEEEPIIEEIIPLTPSEITNNAFEKAKQHLSTISNVPWKRVVFIGDSITYGVQSGMDEPYPVTYPSVFGSLLGVEIENAGIGGSTIWSDGDFAMCERIVNCGYGDAVFVMGGVNDWFHGVNCPIGDTNTTNTFAYDVNILYSHLANKYPQGNIFIVLPLEPACHMGIEPYEPFDLYREVERTLATNYGFHIIDLPSENILIANDVVTQEIYYSDSCHPNSYGYEVLGTILASKSLEMVGIK